MESMLCLTGHKRDNQKLVKLDETLYNSHARTKYSKVLADMQMTQNKDKFKIARWLYGITI